MGVIEELQSRRVPLATLPTPLESAGTLPSGRRLLIKRDDLTGLGIGGNKARKAEMLCAEAVTAGADALVTVGASQSNHARVTAAAGARLGLETHLVLGGSSAGPRQGNQLLAELFGATLHDGATDSWTELARRMDDLVAELRSAAARQSAHRRSCWRGASCSNSSTATTTMSPPSSSPRRPAAPTLACSPGERCSGVRPWSRSSVSPGAADGSSTACTRQRVSPGCSREAEESFGDGDVVFWHTGGQPALFAAGGAPPLGFASDVLSSRSLSLDMERP